VHLEVVELQLFLGHLVLGLGLDHVLKMLHDVTAQSKPQAISTWCGQVFFQTLARLASS
jgi:hypothetical protein